MAAGAKFYEFPRTPHIGGSEVVDDDESVKDIVVPTAAGARKSSQTVIFQEKVDGANVSLHFEREWEPVLQKRSGLIGTGEKQQYEVFRTWVYENLETLYAILNTELVLFGEWMWTQHAIHYTELPSYLIAFDLFDKASQTWLSSPRFQERLAGRIPSVPVLYSGPWPLERGQTIPTLVKSHLKTSRFGTDVAEGIYIRVEDADKVLFRAKWRRKTFVSGRADWGKVDKRNSLASKPPSS